MTLVPARIFALLAVVVFALAAFGGHFFGIELIPFGLALLALAHVL